MPIASFDGPLLGFKKSRSREKDEKLRQEKAKMKRRRNIETRKNLTQMWGSFWSFLAIKLVKIEILTLFWPND